VIDFELPAERTRLWHNAMDAEQHYGLLGEYAGDSASAPEPGGDVSRWRGMRSLAGDDALRLRAGHDEANLYLALETRMAVDSARWVIGIDTWRRDRGQFRLPGEGKRLPVGVEFAIVITDSADAQLVVTPTYNPYLGPRPGMRATDLDAFTNDSATADAIRDDGRFDSLFVTTNRFRIARNGREFPAHGVNRGRLRYGRASESTRADWFVDRSGERPVIELRLPWGLLNVTDPSSRTVLLRITGRSPYATAVTDGFRFVVSARSPAGTVLAELPPDSTYTWRGWETPTWHERLKPAYAAMRQVWGEDPP